MTNPWLKLPSQPEYVLEIDASEIKNFNSSLRRSDDKIELDSIPEPYIGNPETAKLVLLLLNPGHADGDKEAHADPQFKEALFRNLRGELQEYPFYPLNPAFSSTPSAKWWTRRLKELKEKADLTAKDLSQKILAIEWFPYHSKSSGLPAKLVCQSQKYTFELAKKLQLADRLVLRMRSEKHWSIGGSEFENIRALKNPRCGHISPRNMDAGLFDQIVKTLKRAE